MAILARARVSKEAAQNHRTSELGETSVSIPVWPTHFIHKEPGAQKEQLVKARNMAVFLVPFPPPSSITKCYRYFTSQTCHRPAPSPPFLLLWPSFRPISSLGWPLCSPDFLPYHPWIHLPLPPEGPTCFLLKYGVLPQGHRCEALYQGHRTKVTSKTDWALCNCCQKPQWSAGFLTPN